VPNAKKLQTHPKRIALIWNGFDISVIIAPIATAQTLYWGSCTRHLMTAIKSSVKHKEKQRTNKNVGLVHQYC
jgi:hypothetical protein